MRIVDGEIPPPRLDTNTPRQHVRVRLTAVLSICAASVIALILHTHSAHQTHASHDTITTTMPTALVLVYPSVNSQYHRHQRPGRRPLSGRLLHIHSCP